MNVQLAPHVIDVTQDHDDAEFDLDITFIEAGGTVEHIIKMTEDNCGGTCESACTSC